MDLRPLAKSLLRFWYVTLLGTVAAVVLAVLAVASFKNGKLEYRESSQYRASVVVLVTEPGGPELRAVLPTAPDPAATAKPGTGTAATPTPATTAGPIFADPTRLNSLAGLYAYFIKSDQVCTAIGHDVCKPNANGSVSIGARVLASAAAVEETGSQGFPGGLPLIEIQVVQPTPQLAITIANRAASALISYVERKQEAESVDNADRVRIDVNRSARNATLVTAPSKTPAIAAFMGVMLATVLLVVALSNIWPRRAPDDPRGPTARLGRGGRRRRREGQPAVAPEPILHADLEVERATRVPR
jgi:hypothetical protein